ncbi:MAG: zinc metalloprotease HtpX [Thermoplasmata archaeon]|nr:zinc metalloprotease HtpX [Thermoplasmata archaeon]
MDKILVGLMNPTLRTIGLFALLTLLFIFVGYIIGYLYGDTVSSILFFLIIAFIINLFSYFFSAKIVLWSYHAKIISENDNPRIFRIVSTVAQKAKIPVPKIAIIDTQVPNAFATGRNKKNAVVAVTTGILNILNDDELEAVIGHEMGHIKDRDILVMTVAATIAGALSFAARMSVFQAMFSGRDRNNNSIITIIVLALAAFAAFLIQLAISRQREFKADMQSAKITGKPLALANALRKLEENISRRPLKNGNPSTASLFIVNPFRGSSFLNLFSTHPPTHERIKRLEEIARKDTLESFS